MMSMFRTILTCFSLLGFLMVSAPVSASPMTSHRAVYEVKIVKPQPGSSIISGKGLMTIQIEKSCDGWITGQTWHMTMNAFDGKSFQHDIRYATWESFDGLSYRFSVSDKGNGQTKTFKGKATTKSVPGEGQAHFVQPKKMTVELPADTVFPISHVTQLIKKAADGNRLVPFVLFDGASEKGPLRVATFISDKKSSQSIDMPVKHKLLTVGGWNMRMAFFPSKGRSAEPEYELEVMQLENGIVPTAMQVFPDFTIQMKLKKIEGLKPTKCS
jgi:hypothetical protein